MKRVATIFLLILILPLVFAASIDTKTEYDSGETIIAKISTIFLDPLEQNNVIFYRGHTRVPFDFETKKLGDYYFIKADTINKNPDDYSIQIENQDYYSSGQIIDTPFSSNFTLTNETAEFSIDPAIFATPNQFSIELTSLSDETLDVSIHTPSEISSDNSVELGPAQKKTIQFTPEKLTEDKLVTIDLDSGKTSYEIPVLVYASSTLEKCGNEIIDPGEQCDNTEWGDISGCVDFGFEKGTLSCFLEGSVKECTFDTSDCYNDSSGEPVCGNGIIEAGEQCDDDEFGSLDSCKDFNFDAGKLYCDDDCDIDTDDCYDYEECERDRDCDDGFECNNDRCERIDDYCERDRDCDDGYYCNDDDECERKECDYKNRECNDDEECENYECVPDDRECDSKDPCSGDKICVNYKCVDNPLEKECTKDSDCKKSGDECNSQGKCVPDKQTTTLCSDLGGKEVCATDETCSGEFQIINSDRICCFENCVKDSGDDEGGLGKIVGYVLLGFIILGLVYFYFKFKKTRRKNPNLLKLGKSPRVKGSLLR